MTPAESRELNRECIVLGFYDEHDIWHFLSASAMFFSFLVSMAYLSLDTVIVYCPLTVYLTSYDSLLYLYPCIPVPPSA